ncbi:MAG: DUF6370 family protein [Crocinitomicaceae bacterium]
MKYLFLLTVSVLSSCAVIIAPSNEINRIAKASCGKCNFEMTSDECELAIELNGKYYFVEGSSIDEHGDVHNAAGLCSKIRDAKVLGKVKHGVFVAEKFELIDIK